jgi:uncharacterized protein (DUF2236 family)
VASLFPSETELDDILVGPQSLSWRITSDVRLNVAMLYPLLLQVAHPTVDAGVTDFSDFERRPWDRLMRTLDYAYLIVYGGRDAVAAGRSLHALHRRFRGVTAEGARYSALEPKAYAWVHATLLQTYVLAQARFGTPLEADEIERFYLEYRGLGRLIGVRERDLPPRWSGFCAYFEQMCEQTLRRTASVERVLRTVRHVQKPPMPMPELLWRAVRVPAARMLRVGGVGLMSPRLRRTLGIAWNPLDEAQLRALGAALRGLTPIMPARLRVTGPAQLQLRGEAIADGPLAANADN